jgi:hypothetical protein
MCQRNSGRDYRRNQVQEAAKSSNKKASKNRSPPIVEILCASQVQ